MKSRQLKKLKNQYLTEKDIVNRSKKHNKVLDAIAESVDSHFETIKNRPSFYDKDFSDEVLNKFIIDNLDKISFNKNHFNDLFNDAMSKLTRDKFMEVDLELSEAENMFDFYNILLEKTDFDFYCFKNISNQQANTLEVKFTLNYDNFIVFDDENMEQSIKELHNILGFEFNWFQEPFIVLNRYKTGTGKKSIKYVITYLSFYFDKAISYEENPKKFINVSNPTGKKGKGKKNVKVPVKNWEEQFNKRYLYSSKNNNFYKLISEITEEIIIDEGFIVLKVNHEYFNEIIFYK